MAQQQLSTNTFGVAKWIVSPTASDGTHTTIASALTASSSGDTIFIRPGTYTENITLKAGVNLSAFDCDALTPNVKIVGTCTMTATGTCSISGIRLQTNSANIISITGTNVVTLNLRNCYLNCTNNTGISVANVNAIINCYECEGDLGTTGIAYYTSTGAIWFYQCYLNNTGNSLTASLSNGAGQPAVFVNTTMSAPISTSTNSAFISAKNSYFGAVNTTCITLAGTGGSNLDSCILSSGTASALSIGTGCSCIVERCGIDSSNTNCITGAGTIAYQGLTFIGTDSPTALINVTTQTGGTLKGGLNQAPSAGFLGEQIRSFLPGGSLVTLSTGVDATITSISLTAGIWDISGMLQYNAAGTTTVTLTQISISTTNNTIDSNYGDQSLAFTPSLAGVAGIIPVMTIPSFRATLTTTTIYYLVASANFSTSTCKAYGRISATRVG